MEASDFDLKEFQKKLDVKKIAAIVGVALLIAALYSMVFVVDQKEEAIILRLGKALDKPFGPGLHFKMPFGIDKNKNVPIQRNLIEEFGFRTKEAGVVSRFATGNFLDESLMLTGDLNIVDVRWIIQYRIIDPVLWLFKVENQQKTIRDISQSVINLLVGDRTIFDIMGNERANVEDQGMVMMNKYFDLYQLGIRVETVKLQNIVPPPGTVQDAFEDVNKAIQDRNRLINEGKEAYNNAIPKARGFAQKTIQEAEGYAAEKINQAKGDISRFVAVFQEYKKNPAITRTRLYYEMCEEVFGKDSQAMELIDKNLKNFVPFKSLNQKTTGGN